MEQSWAIWGSGWVSWHTRWGVEGVRWGSRGGVEICSCRIFGKEVLRKCILSTMMEEFHFSIAGYAKEPVFGCVRLHEGVLDPFSQRC